jgi:arylsulfatase A-like enzyme
MKNGIVRYPKAFNKGEVCDEFVSNCLDFAPTIESLLSLPTAGVRHGMPLMDTIAGNNPEKFSVSTSNGQQFGLFTQRCIRNHKYKYIWNLTDIDEFYDLEADPGEKVNRINSPQYSQIISEMKSKLKDALKRRNDPFCNGSVEWQLGKG